MSSGNADDRMTPMANSKPDVSAAAVADWLRSHLGPSAHNVEPLAGGFWSAAFAFQQADESFVVRFNREAEGFETDRAAHAFAAAGLPIPEVIETGKALGVYYAISRRHYGRFLEEVDPGDVSRLRMSLGDLLARMRRVPSPGRVEWYDASSTLSWHDYLVRGIDHQNGMPSDGRLSMLSSHPDVEMLYEETCARIHELLPACPERRDLVHGDLLHQNVLVSENADEIRALFSWKCSAFGDFMYDVAWCTLWSRWHPGIAATDIFGLTLAANDLDSESRLHIAERHHCYELQIAASHIGWYLWTRNEGELDLLATELRKILSRGPLPAQ